ncbi:MAG TPA: FtsQ-type POTRA domain-containing protein [Rectinema sp.]|nr:FtsQ-type POTRA domain-containing protein [Rectinema sp.]
MTDVRLQEQINETNAQRKKETRSLLSKSDNYSIDITKATTRSETALPGTSATKSSVKSIDTGDKIQISQRIRPSSEQDHPASKEKARPVSNAKISIHPYISHASQASVALSAQAEKLSEAVKPAKPSMVPRKNSGLRILIAVALLCILSAGAAISLPRLAKIETVRVSGLETISENSIIESLGPIGNENLFSINIEQIANSITNNPRIASAKVHRVLPSTLAIDIRERLAVASIAINTEQGSKLILVDGEGIAFASLDADDSNNPELPVVSGIKFEQFNLGQQLPEAILPLFANLAAIKQNSPELLKAFSEIHVERISANNIEIVLYPMHVKTAVRLPLRFSAEALCNALVVLDILHSRGLSDQPSEIDFHSGTVIYQAKEAVSG